MKTKNNQSLTIHLHIERLLGHKVSLGIVLFLMLAALASFDSRVRSVMQEAYAQGWGWMGTYLHHEHPMHLHNTLARVRVTTISGPSA